MSDHVLVPYDDSEQAERALEHVVEKHPDARLTLLHVMDIMQAGYTAPVDSTLPGFWEEWYEQERATAEALLEEAADRPAEVGMPVETATVVGRPARAINEYVEDHDVDQIVIGSHGRSGISRILLGSVAEAVVRRAPVPVTVVR